MSNISTKLGRFAIAAGLCTMIASCAATAEDDEVTTAQPVPPVEVNPVLPTELNQDNGGAPAATLAQAAAFAWQEFIALNWPANTGTAANPQRDEPNPDCKFGDTSAASPCAGGPLTWQTFRGKAEIFPHGTPDTDYDSPPDYDGRYFSAIASCTGTPSSSPAWINLDETTQISENGMFAGAGPNDAAAQAVNAMPQLIRFMAKANRKEFDYYATLRGLPGGLPTIQAATKASIQTVGTLTPTSTGSTQYVSLPVNTIEIKAGWRMLTTHEMGSGRFHTATVRYYEHPSGSPTCYQERTWGLVALHIIQKTMSAPYFIYASFEQADNITDAAGNPVEDADGAIPGSYVEDCPADQPKPCPTTPGLVFTDSPTMQANQIPPQVTLQGTIGNPSVPQAYCQPAKQLYYVNLLPGLPSDGPICINHRYNLIPETIIDANRAAHLAIATYNSQNGVTDSPWLYYKLLNVQYVPYSNTDPTQPFAGNDGPTGANPASYYLANILVETNRPLQMFSGSLVGGQGGTGSNSNYDSQFGGTQGTVYHSNVYYTPPGGPAHGNNMGGCMGCHGAQGQSQGGDFSVILANGPVFAPEPLPSIPATGTAARRGARSSLRR